jgi:hypothetical protein
LTNSGAGDGVYGKATSSGTGVIGINGGSAGIQAGSGVCGSSATGIGVSGNTNDGDGVNGYAAGTGIAVHGTLGSGATTARAGVFEIGNSGSSGNTLEATNAGSGKAGYFRISNSSSTSPAVHVSNASSTADGIYAEANYSAVHGFSHSVSVNKSNGNPQINGVWNGVFGETDLSYGYGVRGLNSSSSGTGVGVYGYCVNGYGVEGQTDTNYGVYGYASSGYGVYGNHALSSGSKAGVGGVSASTTGGSGTDGTVGAVGVFGELSATSGGGYSAAVRGANLSTTQNGMGVAGYQSGSGWGVYGYAASGTGGRFKTGTGTYALYSDGEAYKASGANTWVIASDERLKQDIRPFADGLDVIELINPIWFRYNGKAGTDPRKEWVGVKAQEMQIVAPYTVSSVKMKMDQGDVEESDILTYNSNALTYVQINAIKELNSKLEQLQSQMVQMQTTIEALTQTLKANGITPPAGPGVAH